MGRYKRAGKAKQVRFSETDWEILERMAVLDRRTPAELVRFAVEEYLHNRLGTDRLVQAMKDGTIVSLAEKLQGESHD